MDLSFEIRTAQNVPLALEPASVGQRIVATIIDIAIGIAWIFVSLWAMELSGIDTFAMIITLAWLPPFCTTW